MPPFFSRAFRLFPAAMQSSVRRGLGGWLESGTLRGMGYMLIATLATAGMLALVRVASEDLHPHEVAFFRFLFGFCFFLPVIIRGKGAIFRTKRLPLHMLRGFLNVASMLVFFLAVTMAPLAKVVALKFSAPLFTTVIAVMFLGETIRARRIIALALGFSGVLVIFEPGGEVWDLGSGLVLASAAIWSLAMVTIKMLTRTESSATTTVYTTMMAVPVAFAFAFPHWQWPSLEQLLWMGGIAILGTTSHLSFAQAFKEADVTAVLPLDFTKLIWAAVIGFFAFSEIPSVETWVGGAMICASVTYIAFRERARSGKRPTPG
jgi:drug/metabolite transporter (DMT)-like permease